LEAAGLFGDGEGGTEEAVEDGGEVLLVGQVKDVEPDLEARLAVEDGGVERELLGDGDAAEHVEVLLVLPLGVEAAAEAAVVLVFDEGVKDDGGQAGELVVVGRERCEVGRAGGGGAGALDDGGVRVVEGVFDAAGALKDGLIVEAGVDPAGPEQGEEVAVGLVGKLGLGTDDVEVGGGAVAVALAAGLVEGGEGEEGGVVEEAVFRADLPEFAVDLEVFLLQFAGGGIEGEAAAEGAVDRLAEVVGQVVVAPLGGGEVEAGVESALDFADGVLDGETVRGE